jgi:hypothetical protein
MMRRALARAKSQKRRVTHFKLVALNGLMSPFDPQRAPALKKYLAAKDLKTAVVARSNFF